MLIHFNGQCTGHDWTAHFITKQEKWRVNTDHTYVRFAPTITKWTIVTIIRSHWLQLLFIIAVKLIAIFQFFYLMIFNYNACRIRVQSGTKSLDITILSKRIRFGWDIIILKIVVIFDGREFFFQIRFAFDELIDMKFSLGHSKFSTIKAFVHSMLN